MNRAILEVKNLKKYYPVKGGIKGKEQNSVKAVDDVSFDIYEGEIFGIVGESGSGKSTIGKAVLNLIEPTGGSVKFDDKLIFDVENKLYMEKKELRVVRKNMQMVFQDPYASLDPRMNVEKIITEGIIKHKIYPKNEIKNKAMEILEICGLDKYQLQKYPHQFSGGQRQRIGIARALSLNPKMIICDEPTAALDVSIQSQILNLMLDLKKQFSMSYMFISHNLSIVRELCDRICVLYLGSVVEITESKELFTNTLHPYSKALIESAPSIEKGKDRSRVILTGEIPSPMNPPSGCKFHTRCKFAEEICKTEIPQLREVSEGHYVACHKV